MENLEDRIATATAEQEGELLTFAVATLLLQNQIDGSTCRRAISGIVANDSRAAALSLFPDWVGVLVDEPTRGRFAASIELRGTLVEASAATAPLAIALLRLRAGF